MKLLDIRMVASNFLGFSLSESNNLLDMESSSSIACISFGLNEKKATSDPDINADEAIRTIKSNMGRITSTGNDNNTCPK